MAFYVDGLSVMLCTIVILATLAEASVAPDPPLGPSSGAAQAAQFAAINFDFIVIGGGTAGLTVATRLAEQGQWKIGVVEAGEYRPNDPIIDIPHNFGQALGNASYDWLYTSTPQLNLGNRTVPQNRGKVLGGSSAVNFEVLTRGAAAEYSAWSALNYDSESWSWSALLPSFKKSETYTRPTPADLNSREQLRETSCRCRGIAGRDSSNPTARFTTVADYYLRSLNISAESLSKIARIDSSTSQASSDHGSSGPLQASYNALYSNTFAPYVQSLNNLGVKNNSDAESGYNAGIFDYPHAVDPRTETRSYAASAYYAPNANKKNLVVLTGAQVTRINFESARRRDGSWAAISVTYISNNAAYTVNASKEIILSAGGFNTPQLLELSGIGNASLLANLGIEPLVNLTGVGENLQDHPILPTTYIVKPGYQTWDELSYNDTFAALAAEEYTMSRTGILTSTATILTYVPLQSFLSATDISEIISSLTQELLDKASTLSPLQWAEYAIQLGWLSNPSVPQVELLFNPSFSPSPNVATAAPNTSYITIWPTHQHPISRGSVHISTADPLIQPAINPNYLSSAYDKTVLLETIKFVQKIASTPPLSEVIQSFNDPPASASDEYLANYIEKALDTEYHPSGTAALAPRELNGVVNTDFTVYGTKNLRVVDASIFPILVSAHLQAPVYAIGEKAANVIRGDWL